MAFVAAASIRRVKMRFYLQWMLELLVFSSFSIYLFLPTSLLYALTRLPLSRRSTTLDVGRVRDVRPSRLSLDGLLEFIVRRLGKTPGPLWFSLFSLLSSFPSLSPPMPLSFFGVRAGSFPAQ